MSASVSITPLQMPFIARRTRAYFAPVNRITGQPTPFNPGLSNAWHADEPPAPWIDLGWVYDLVRTSTSKILAVDAGSPSAARAQVRTDLGAMVSCSFASWTKLTMALTSGSEQMNILALSTLVDQSTETAVKIVPALTLQPNSTATTLYPTPTVLSTVMPGNLVVVDEDYTSEAGFIGAGVSATYVKSPAYVGLDMDYVRRVSFNVARVASIASDGGLRLAQPLIAGIPTATMKMQCTLGFVNREGGSFFQEWSGLFLVEGVQGETLFCYYPRLQACEVSKEVKMPLATSLDMIQLYGNFRALPIIDSLDGQAVLCYRYFCPAVSTYI